MNNDSIDNKQAITHYSLDTLQTVTPFEDNALCGFYSNTGFDMIQILSRLINRPNPQIQLGPIDFSCSFAVSDATQPDSPIIYCSPGFERLTNYKSHEIVNKNCRFLQSPDGLVTQGMKRRYTDNQAVYHLKSQLIQGKEHQASIINYRKGGQAFVNLVTVIPLFDAFNQPEYYVGLQVDLVEQPNSILEKMKDGTYIVNYHTAPTVPKPMMIETTPDSYFQEIPATLEGPETNPDILNLLGPVEPKSIPKEWNKLLLDQSLDWIHVITLKGVFLYSCSRTFEVLEYTGEEVVGKNLSYFTHPSDIVPVMREIKEGIADGRDINLIFRIRRKWSGYCWIDSRGKLYMDQSRKCIILSGRERPVYRLPASYLPQHHHPAYWAKINLQGLYLYVTGTSNDVVGFSPQDLTHQSIYQYLENATDLTRALESAKQGQVVSTKMDLLDLKGNYVSCDITFYPGDSLGTSRLPTFLLLYVQVATDDLISHRIKPEGGMPDLNLFQELETIRSTNWQYELYQLQKTNKLLREQLDSYSSNPNKRKKKRKTKNQVDIPKICANCQRKDSPEWRKGPNGPKELCNACGLRYAKSLSNLSS